MKSTLLVLIQFACLAYFIFTDGIFCSSSELLTLQLLAGFIGLWAIMIVRPSKLSIYPEPKAHASLVEVGPYKYIRHPMYTSLILICTIMLTEHHGYITIVVFVVFVTNLIAKIAHEEMLLSQRFPEYQSYVKRTKKLIPFIY